MSGLKGAEGADLDDVVPMQTDRGLGRGVVPRWIAQLAHRNYARSSRQDFDQLHRRGGFSQGELIAHLASELRLLEPEVAAMRRQADLDRDQIGKLLARIELLEREGT